MTRNIVVRPMTAEDIDQVSGIENRCFLSPWPREAFEEELAQGRLCRYLVIEADGRAAGYAGMRLLIEEAHVTNVAIDEIYRAQGMGTTLMRALIQTASNAGCLFMELERRASNQAAQALYHKLGFFRVGCKKGYYTDTGEDAIVMALFPLPKGDPEADDALVRE